MKIAVVGMGYVGLSLATLLSQKNEVIALDILSDKVDMINKRISPICDNYIEKYFKEKQLNLKATLDYKEAFEGAEFIIICTPTSYDENLNVFDTSQVEEVIQKIISFSLNSTIVVKSTVSVGFIDSIKKKYNINNIMFSPEFLREGQALYDNLYPSRIIIGEKSKRAEVFANLLKEASLKENVIIKYMNSKEAESVKLFSNTYLALRISYFNELDTYAEINNLNTKDIIDGVCLDPRIGNYYNNPSFGYGGYCLPKDTKQLLSNYKDIPQSIISAVVSSNDLRKKHVVDTIIGKNCKLVGIYRLTMKSNSDNFRFSSIHYIIDMLKLNNINMIIYEPMLKQDVFNEIKVVNDLKTFKDISSIIVANRIDNNLIDCYEKVYTRDLFNRD